MCYLFTYPTYNHPIIYRHYDRQHNLNIEYCSCRIGGCMVYPLHTLFTTIYFWLAYPYWLLFDCRSRYLIFDLIWFCGCWLFIIRLPLANIEGDGYCRLSHLYFWHNPTFGRNLLKSMLSTWTAGFIDKLEHN